MPRRFTALSMPVIVLAVLGLSGCTHYRYIQPDTEQGLQCVKKLDAGVRACEEQVNEAVRSEKAFYDWQMISYRACNQQMPSSAQQPQPCGPAPREPGAEQQRLCRQDYRQSFIACGGRVEQIKD